MWDARHPLNSLLWEAAVEDMGMYPRSIIKDGVETHRTEWQDGWNEAVIAMTRKHGQFLIWARALPEESVKLLAGLMDSDGDPIHLSIRDGEVRLAIICNDTFAYACGDMEDFTLQDLPDVARLYEKHGYPGLIAWIARKRNSEPVREWRLDSHYLAAKADL